MTRGTIVPAGSELYRQLRQAAEEQRCIFFAGLPGVGKSLLLQQLALIAVAAGRRVHLLQWDVARGPFERPDLLARYPETDGVTHPAIRKAVGVWARGAVAAWDARHADPTHLLIGEAPLIGNRLIELARPRPDAVEPLLAGERSVFLIPVPSREVRQAIEAARVRELATPIHERERANAIPSLVRALWEEIAAVARELQIEPTSGAKAGDFDPDLYASVYLQLLRHRPAVLLQVATTLPVRGSVYDSLDVASELLPTPEEVGQVMPEVQAWPAAEIEREVADWFRL